MRHRGEGKWFPATYHRPRSPRGGDGNNNGWKQMCEIQYHGFDLESTSFLTLTLYEDEFAWVIFVSEIGQIRMKRARNGMPKRFRTVAKSGAELGRLKWTHRSGKRIIAARFADLTARKATAALNLESRKKSPGCPEWNKVATWVYQTHQVS